MIQKFLKRSIGLNGVGTKAVNALSSSFKVQSVRDGQTVIAKFSKGILQDVIKEETNKKWHNSMV